MPGIVGIVGAGKPEENKAALDAMLKCMLHEASYRSGVLVDERHGLWLGWTCHPGSFGDCLPIWNEQKDICLIFSGEDFRDPAEIASLQTKGHQFEPGNASYLVHLYEEMGPGFLERLNGWFCGVVVDLREGKTILFNDRYGISRIYYHESTQGLFFSSEAKSLLKVLPQLRSLDHASLGEYVSCGCVLQNRSFFRGVSLLPGASAWTLRPGQPPGKATYFKPETWEGQPVLGAPEFYAKLKEVWNRILPRSFGGREAVALSLTGGVDSRMILASAPRSPGTLPCYTFGGIYRDCADVTVSRQVAHLAHQDHETIPLSREFFSEFPALAEKAVYITDGVLDVTGSTDLFVHRRARQIAPIRVTGLYGGEILRSIFVFKPMPQTREHFSPEFARCVEGTTATYAAETKGHRQSFISFKQAPWHIYSRLSIERSQMTIRTPYFDNDLVALSFQAPPESLTYGPALRLIAETNPAMEAVGTDRGVGLRSIPGVTQARHLFQEFTFKAEYAYDYGMPQQLAKLDHVFAPLHLERLFLGRHKYYHFRVWYRDHFANYLKQVLLDGRTLNRPYLRGATFEKMVKGHLKGNANYTLEIHRMITAELMQRQLIEQP